MAKIRTLDELQIALDNAFSWRIKEIADLKIAVRGSSGLSKNTIIRAGVALVYAHWEGFVKSASEDYLRYVSSQRLRFDELVSCFAVLGLKKHLLTITESRDVSLNVEAIDFLRRKGEERADLSIENVIKTYSNLNDAVFCNIVNCIGVDRSGYEPYFHFISESLVSRRNAIAHGENSDRNYSLDEEGFRELADQVIYLLRTFKADIENSAALERFKA